MREDDLVSRADTLMRRRRSFVAAPPGPVHESELPQLIGEPEPDPTPVLADETDIPVLTDEVSPDIPDPAPSHDRFDEQLASRLAAEFSHSLERRLAGELPGLVEASLAVLEADLRRGILDIANEAIKDFVARREQLRLPLEDQDV